MSDDRRNGFLFAWTIENFSFCYTDSIASPYFADENFSQMPWQLVLNLIDNGEASDEDYINCELCKYIEDKDVVIDFKIEIIGASGCILGVFEENNSVFNSYHLNKVSSLFERDAILRDILETNKDILTVCCQMYRNESGEACSSDCTARTKIIVNQQIHRLNWTKHSDISKLLKKEDAVIESTICFPDMNQYYIIFQKKSNGDGITTSILRSDSESSQCVKCKISLMDVKGYLVVLVKDTHLFPNGENSWNLPSFLSISELTSNESKYIKNGSIVILLELLCSGGIESQAVSYRNTERKWFAGSPDVLTVYPTLQSNFRSFLSNEKFCDVKLRVNDEIVQAHKPILAARSPIFHAMFQQDMLESQTDIVDIQDLDIDTLKLLVNFVYCDAVEKMDYERAKNLLIAAEKYQVLRLKEICASFLKSDISEKNACEVVTLADMVNHTDLKSFAVGFIVDHSKVILLMPEWLPWIKNHMELASEILQKLTEKLAS